MKNSVSLGHWYYIIQALICQMCTYTQERAFQSNTPVQTDMPTHTHTNTVHRHNECAVQIIIIILQKNCKHMCMCKCTHLKCYIHYVEKCKSTVYTAEINLVYTIHIHVLCTVYYRLGD